MAMADGPDCFYCIVGRNTKMADMKTARSILDFLDQGYRTYRTAEEAERGRLAHDAYDNPSDGRVMGFRVKPFLPKKERGRRQ